MRCQIPLSQRNQPALWLGRMMVLCTLIHTDLVSCAWMQDDMAAQLRCRPILLTNNVPWVINPEHGWKVVFVTN